MNITKENIIYLPSPKKKTDFNILEDAKIIHVEEHLENIVKSLIHESRINIEKYKDKLHYFIDTYPDNPYSQFGYALFLLARSEYAVAHRYASHGLDLDNYNLDGIKTNIRILSYLIDKDKKYINEAERFMEYILEKYPENLTFLIHAYSLQKHYIKNKEKLNMLKSRIIKIPKELKDDN